MASIYESFSIQKVWTKGPLTLIKVYADKRWEPTHLDVEGTGEGTGWPAELGPPTGPVWKMDATKW